MRFAVPEKIKRKPRPLGRSEPRRSLKSEEETTSSNFPKPPLNCTDGLVTLDQGWEHTYGVGFFAAPSSKYKSSLLLSPFLRNDFTSQKPRDRFVFAHILSLCWLRQSHLNARKKKKKLQELETDYAFGISLPIHQQLTRSCFNFCCFNTCSGPKTLPNFWQHLGKTLLRKQFYHQKCLFQKRSR